MATAEQSTERKVSDQTRLAVWNTLCDLEWNVRYYTELAGIHLRRHRWTRFLLLAGVLTDAALFYVGATNTLALYAGIGVLIPLALGTIWDALSNLGESATLTRLTAYACDDLHREVERLWREIEANTISNDDVEARHSSLTDRWARITERTHPAAQGSLRKKTADDSSRSVGSRYATLTRER